MLLTRFENFDLFSSGAVISFVGYANFLKIPVSTLDQIYWYADGRTMKYRLKKKGVTVETHCFDFSGLANKVFSYCMSKNYRILFIGGTKIENDNFLLIIRRRYPNIKIKGIDGYNEIKEFNPKDHSDVDICVYGLGSPLQEQMAIKYMNEFKLSFTCGAFITQTHNAGKEYYPSIILKFNLRWLYRILKEKGHFYRLFKAYLQIKSVDEKVAKIKFKKIELSQ